MTHPSASLISCVVAGMILMGLSACAGGGPSAVAPPEQDTISTNADAKLSASLWFSFDSTELAYDGRRVFVDAQGRPYAGRIKTAHGGAVETRPGPAGLGEAVAFPGQCRADVCPRALIEIENTEDLNPGTQDFSYGATVLIHPDETSLGSNIVQKGRFQAPGGQWKLQVDTLDGMPSCVVQYRDAVLRVRSPVTVANSTWHDIACYKSAEGLEIVVDGERESRRGLVPTVTTESLIRIGSPGLDQTDDQFHGAIDDVFLRIGGAD